MRSWAHSGFNANASVRIGADDATGRENLARYLIRASFSMDKSHCDNAAQTVIYNTKMVEGPNRNFEIFGQVRQEGFRSRPAGLPGLRRRDADHRIHRGPARHARNTRAPVVVVRSQVAPGHAGGGSTGSG